MESAALFPMCDTAGGEATFGRADTVTPLVAVLQQFAQVMRQMTDEQYCRRPVGTIDSSVGGHVRHCLDHFESLAAGIANGTVNYERRERDTIVEHNRQAGLLRLRQVRDGIVRLNATAMSRELWLQVLFSPEAELNEVRTTVGRELAFLLSHTVHHQALVAVMCQIMGVEPPDRFGHAPSTIAHAIRSEVHGRR